MAKQRKTVIDISPLLGRDGVLDKAEREHAVTELFVETGLLDRQGSINAETLVDKTEGLTGEELEGIADDVKASGKSVAAVTVNKHVRWALKAVAAGDGQGQVPPARPGRAVEDGSRVDGDGGNMPDADVHGKGDGAPEPAVDAEAEEPEAPLDEDVEGDDDATGGEEPSEPGAGVSDDGGLGEIDVVFVIEASRKMKSRRKAIEKALGEFAAAAGDGPRMTLVCIGEDGAKVSGAVAASDFEAKLPKFRGKGDIVAGSLEALRKIEKKGGKGTARKDGGAYLVLLADDIARLRDKGRKDGGKKRLKKDSKKLSKLLRDRYEGIAAAFGKHPRDFEKSGIAGSVVEVDGSPEGVMAAFDDIIEKIRAAEQRRVGSARTQ